VIFDEGRLKALIAEAVREVLGDRGPAARYLRVAEAAEYAGVSAPTIREWVKNRRLRRYGAGRLMRVKQSELDELLASPNRPAATPEEAADRYLRRRRGA
jgi:excisionase family DNA binding protein